MELQRLDKVIANRTGKSRKEVKNLAREGRILLNGSPIKHSALDTKIRETDIIMVDNSPVDLRQHIYLMMNKPLGVLSAARDKNETTVVDLVPENLARPGLFPAGRLDKDTTGFVLLTDDGAFAHRMLSPRSHVPKIYHARLDRYVDEERFKEMFAAGMELDNGDHTLPAGFRLLEEGDSPLAEITLREGMYHQVRRMVAAAGARVETLQRVQIGMLKLDSNLMPGECREIYQQEKYLLCVK